RVALTLTGMIGNVTPDPLLVLLLINTLLLQLRTFTDMAPLCTLTSRVSLPMSRAYGVYPLKLRVTVIMSLRTGLNTPPLGPVQFVAAAVGKITVWEAMRSIWPFYLAGLIVLGMVTYIPALSLWLPSLFR